MSSVFFNVAFTAFAAFWLFFAARKIAHEIQSGLRWNAVMALMGVLIMVGAGGFFAMGLSALGVLRLPNSAEWPAGRVSGVAKMPDGTYVVPLVPMGRVQLYDPEWHFLRGWNVKTYGGDFKIECPPYGTIEVLTARERLHYSFKPDGSLTSAKNLRDSEDFNSIQTDGESVDVPTSPVLWIFSSPFLSWAVALAGMLGMAVVGKFRKM